MFKKPERRGPVGCRQERRRVEKKTKGTANERGQEKENALREAGQSGYISDMKLGCVQYARGCTVAFALPQALRVGCCVRP